MQSTTVEHLKPEFEPVAVVWSETIPNAAHTVGFAVFGGLNEAASRQRRRPGVL